MVQKILRTLFILNTAFLSPSLLAQDYPYDDVELKREEGAIPVEKITDETQEEVSTAPGTVKKLRKKLPPLFRLSLKAGGNFSFFQSPSVADTALTDSVNGFGLDALVGAGWDLPYQPLFIEFESGYRNLFLTENSSLHVIPLSFGIAYRNRIGRRSLLRLGLRPSLDFQIQDTTDEVSGLASSSFALVPTMGFFMTVEIRSFLIEPSVTIIRIQSQRSFISTSLRLGYRF